MTSDRDPMNGVDLSSVPYHELVRQQLRRLGEDPSRPGLSGTPDRVESAMKWLTRGYSSTAAEAIGSGIFVEPHDNMILVKDIELYQGAEPIFDAYGIEDEVGRALSRKVPLPSGGYLVIDQAEALTAIDVNTGRYVGKGSKDLEETAFKTNLEAVDEIAYQLRFRNIGGLVILDLIDMEQASSRDKVWRALEQRLAKDKAKTTLNRISDLGLIEMTRKRTRESLSRTMREPCFYCDGTGQIMSRHSIAYEILRQIRRERESLPGYSVVVNAHPAIIDLMKTEEKAAVAEAERRYMRRIELNPRREYHIEQFDLQGK